MLRVNKLNVIVVIIIISKSLFVCSKFKLFQYIDDKCIIGRIYKYNIHIVKWTLMFTLASITDLNAGNTCIEQLTELLLDIFLTLTHTTCNLALEFWIIFTPIFCRINIGWTFIIWIGQHWNNWYQYSLNGMHW